MTAVGPWYISASAVRDYCALRGWGTDGDDDQWYYAEGQLIRMAQDCVARERSGQSLPRANANGTMRYRMGREDGRIYLVVAPPSEGPLPSLVAVQAATGAAPRTPYRRDS